METIIFENHLYQLSDGDINENDFWIYVIPKEWVNIKQEGFVKSNMPSSWFDKLWDRSNYKKIIGSTNSVLNLPILK